MGTNTNSPQGPYIRVSDLVDVGGAVVVPIPQKDTGGTGASETGKVHTKIRMEKVEGKQLYKRDGFYFERQFREAWKGTGNVDPFEGNAYGIDVAVSAEEQTQFEKVVQEMDTDDGKEDTVDVVKEALKSCLKSGQSGNIRILLGPSENVIAMLSATKLTKIALATDLMRLFVTILAAFSESKESIWATFSVAYLVKVLEHDASCDKRTRQIVPKMLKPLYVSQLVLLVVRLMCAGIIRGMSHSELSNMLENLGRPLHDLVVKMNSYITNDLRNKEAKALYEECKNEKLNEAMDAFVEKNESSPVASAAEEKSVSDDFAASGVPGTVEICGPRSRVDATQGDTSPKGTLHPKVGEKEGNEPMEKEQQLANGSEQTSKKREGKKKKRNAADITQPLISSDDVLGTPLLDCNREVIHQDEDDRGYNIPSCYKLVHDDSDGTPLVFPDVDTTKSRKKLKEGLDAISSVEHLIKGKGPDEMVVPFEKEIHDLQQIQFASSRLYYASTHMEVNLIKTYGDEVARKNAPFFLLPKSYGPVPSPRYIEALVPTFLERKYEIVTTAQLEDFGCPDGFTAVQVPESRMSEVKKYKMMKEAKEESAEKYKMMKEPEEESAEPVEADENSSEHRASSCVIS